MTAPGDVVGQAVVNVRTCGYAGGPYVWQTCDPRRDRCPGCQGDGTWLDTDNPTMVDPWGAWLTAEKDGKPWCNHDANEWCSLAPDEHVRHPTYRVRPVENGDTE